MIKYLEIAGVAVGLLYLYFEYRASVWLWLTGIIMPAIYIFVYFSAGFYADMGINVYYLIAGFYGWALWLGKGNGGRKKLRTEIPADEDAGYTLERRNGGAAPLPAMAYESAAGDVPERLPADFKIVRNSGPTDNMISQADETHESYGADGATETGGAGAVVESDEAPAIPITRAPAGVYMPLLTVSAVCFVIIAFVLVRFTDSTVPYGDSFTTALSVAGLWMLAKKYVEQWLVWIAVDVVSSALYFYKELYPTAFLFALYSIIAVFGYFKWLGMMRKQDRVNPNYGDGN